MIKPFFEEWGHFLGAPGLQLTENIAANIAKWEVDGESALGVERAAMIKAPPKLVATDETEALPAVAAVGSPPSSPSKKGAPVAAPGSPVRDS